MDKLIKEILNQVPKGVKVILAKYKDQPNLLMWQFGYKGQNIRIHTKNPVVSAEHLISEVTRFADSIDLIRE